MWTTLGHLAKSWWHGVGIAIGVDLLGVASEAVSDTGGWASGSWPAYAGIIGAVASFITQRINAFAEKEKQHEQK